MKILILNGPSLNLLGKRNPDVYGNHTLEDIQKALNKKAQQINIELIFAQSNHEGELIDTLQKNLIHGDLTLPEGLQKESFADD